MMLRERILAAKPSLVELDVPEWGGEVYIRKLTLAERTEVQRLQELVRIASERNDADAQSKHVKGLQSYVLSLAVRDVDGNEVLRAGDFDGLEGAVAVRVFQDAMRVSGLWKAPEQSVQQAEGN